MDKRVIFLDIDGTLVKENQQISDKVKQALSDLRKNGHYVFLCTGRNRKGVQELMDLQLFDGTICSAGGYIELNNHLIYEAGMDYDDVHKAKDVFLKYDMPFMLEANFEAFQSADIYALLTGEEKKNSEIKRIEEENKKSDIKTIKEYEKHPLTIHTIVFISEEYEKVLKAQKELSDRFHFLIYQKKGCFYNGELMKKGVNKGTGIKKVMDYLHLSLEQSIGFGDSMNDVEMIETCGYSVVMENGDERLKKLAHYVCESVEDDGIYYELKRLSLIEK